MARYAHWYPAGADLTVDEPIVLHDSARRNARVMVNHSGWDAPPWETTLVRTPGVDGAMLQDVAMGPRQLTVPVFIRAESREEVREWKSLLVRAMNPTAGPGTLVLADGLGEPWGDARRVGAVYRDGLRGDGTMEGSDWWRFTVTLDALDPYWYSFVQVEALWTGRPATAPYPWSYPWSYSPDGVDVAVPLELGGDAPTWPVLALTPPFLRVKVTNDRSGKWWEIRRDSGDRLTPLTVDHSTAQVRDDAGVNRYGQLVDGSTLFDLLPGDTVSVQVDGGAAATRIALSAGEAWLAL